MTKLPIIWEEYHYVHFEKSKDWKWSVGIISVTIALVAFMLTSITFGFLILVATLVLLIHALQPPKMLRFEIHQSGVRIDQEKWNFSDLKSFYIEDNREFHNHSRILFRTDHVMSPLLVLPLPLSTDQRDLHDLREELTKLLPEEKMAESFFQRMLEYFGF
ncbi:MAG: hypothetical protein RJB39_242 [Candidatus Parcubacteria bacterium]|jgi:hypothetical protein